MFIRFNEKELQNFVIQIDDTPLNYQQEYIDVREEIWQKTIEQNPKFWNGKVCDVRKLYSISNQFILKLRISEFKDSIARENLTDDYILEKFGIGCLQKAAAVHLLAFDRDKKIILGRRSKNVFKENHRFALIGGTLSPDEVEIRTLDDMKSLLVKEFKEEAGFAIKGENMNFYGLSYYKSIYAFIFVLNENLNIKDFAKSDNFEFDEFVSLSLPDLSKREDLDDVFSDIQQSVTRDFD